MSSAPASAGWPRGPARRSRAPGHRASSRSDGGRRQAGPATNAGRRSASTPGRACSRCPRCSPTCSRPGHRCPTWCRWTRRAAPFRRRHRAGLVRRPGRVRRPDRAPRSAPAAAADWQRLWRRAARVWDASWRAHPAARRSTSPLAWPGWPGGCGDLAAVAPGPDAARAGPALPARPAAADAAGPLRDVHRRRPAPGAGRAGRDPVRRAGLRRLVPARRPGARWPTRCWRRCVALGVAVPHRHGRSTRIDAAGGRVHGVRLADGARVPADVVVANADALHVYRDLLPHARAGWPRLRRPQPRRLRAAARRPRARRPGLAHHTVFFPADYDAEFDAVFGAPARPADRPDGLRHRRRRPARAPGRARGLVRAGQRAAARHGRRGRLATARAGRRVRRPGARRARRARTRRPRPAAVPRDPHAGRPGGRDRRAGRRDLRHAPGRACCARPTAARCAACTWSAAPPTRAAGCRWSRCRPQIVADRDRPRLSGAGSGGAVRPART